MKPLEVVRVKSEEVYCDGGASGHPRVFLHIDRAIGQVTCPYCSKTYLHSEYSGAHPDVVQAPGKS